MDNTLYHQNQNYERKNSIIDINDIWHTDFEPKTSRKVNNGHVNGNISTNEDTQPKNNNKAIFVTWSDINVILPKKVGFLEKLKKKIKNEPVSKAKVLIENGKCS